MLRDQQQMVLIAEAGQVKRTRGRLTIRIVGMGISILPEMATRVEVEQGKIVVLPWILPDVQELTQMVWHKEKWLSPALLAFIEAAVGMQW